ARRQPATAAKPSGSAAPRRRDAPSEAPKAPPPMLDRLRAPALAPHRAGGFLESSSRAGRAEPARTRGSSPLSGQRETRTGWFRADAASASAGRKGRRRAGARTGRRRPVAPRRPAPPHRRDRRSARRREVPQAYLDAALPEALRDSRDGHGVAPHGRRTERGQQREAEGHRQRGYRRRRTA